MTTAGHGNADVLAQTAKARQSEQGALKQGGIDLLVMPPKLKGRLPLWRACSVEPLRRSAERRNLEIPAGTQKLAHDLLGVD